MTDVMGRGFTPTNPKTMDRQAILNELTKRGIQAKVVFKRGEAWLYLGHSNFGRLLRQETFEVPEYRDTFFNELKGDLELSLQY